MPLPDSHGLNETLTWQWQPDRNAAAAQSSPTPDQALAVYAEAFHLNAQALVAIACGAVRQGYEKAQGICGVAASGRRADPAACSRAADAGADCQRAANGGICCASNWPVFRSRATSLGTVLAVRAEAHNLLCDGGQRVAADARRRGLYVRSRIGEDRAGLQSLAAAVRHAGRTADVPVGVGERRMNDIVRTAGAAEVGVQPLGCPSDPLRSASSARQSLAGHLPAGPPFVAPASLPLFPAVDPGHRLLRAGLDLGPGHGRACRRRLAELRRQTRQFAEQELRPRALDGDLRPHDPATDAAVIQRAAESGVLFGHLPPPLGTGAVALADYPLGLGGHGQGRRVVRGLRRLGADAVRPCPGHDAAAAVRRQEGLETLSDSRPTTGASQGRRTCSRSRLPSRGRARMSRAATARRMSRPETVARRADGRLGAERPQTVHLRAATSRTRSRCLPRWKAKGWSLGRVFWWNEARRDSAGLRNESKMGQRASGAAELELRDVFVPDDHVIGELRTGWALNRASLDVFAHAGGRHRAGHRPRRDGCGD